MLLSKRLPFWDFEKAFSDMTKMFDAVEGPLSIRSMPRGTFPAINIYDNEKAILLTAEIPGLTAEDIELTVVENSVTIKGNRQDANSDENEKYYRRERPQGEFNRTISLPEKVDPEAVTAEYKNGILTITMPRVEKDQPRKITVKNS
jgi:HSP20 family protein